MIIVHLISRWSFSSGIPIKAATRFMLRSMRFVSAALSISNFPVRSKRSNFLRNNKISRSVKISFSIFLFNNGILAYFLAGSKTDIYPMIHLLPGIYEITFVVK